MAASDKLVVRVFVSANPLQTKDDNQVAEMLEQAQTVRLRGTDRGAKEPTTARLGLFYISLHTESGRG